MDKQKQTVAELKALIEEAQQKIEELEKPVFEPFTLEIEIDTLDRLLLLDDLLGYPTMCHKIIKEEWERDQGGTMMTGVHEINHKTVNPRMMYEEFKKYVNKHNEGILN